MKAQVWLKAVTSNLCPEFYQRFCPDHCILLYQKKGNVCEIYDKHQVFQTLDCIRYWKGARTVSYLCHKCGVMVKTMSVVCIKP